MMKKISVSLSGHQTSISLESEFVDALQQIARRENKTIATIIADIDAKRTASSNLSAAVRIYILHYFMTCNK